MSDARWLEVMQAAESAATYFSFTARLYEAGGFNGDSLDAYRARMGFMHAAQSAHTSLESGLLRVLDLLREERPSGEHRHQDLITRVCFPMEGPRARPPILSEKLGDAADETRRFRNLATRGYDSFDADLARRTVEAARVIANGCIAELKTFRNAIDGD